MLSYFRLRAISRAAYVKERLVTCSEEDTDAMKFAQYVAWILNCKHCKFDEKNTTIPENIEFLLGGYFLAHPIYEVRSYETTTRNPRSNTVT